MLAIAPLTAPPLALTVAELVNPPLTEPPVWVKVPPVTLTPPLSWPALVVVPAVLVNRPDTVPPALLLKVAALFTAPVMVAWLSTAPVPEIATVPRIRLLLVTVPPLTVAPALSRPPLVVVPAVLVNRPDIVPPALLLNVAALFTTPVMVTLFSTSPVPEIATVPRIKLLLVTVPPLTVAPPLSWPALIVVPAVLVSSPDTVPLALLLKVAALFDRAGDGQIAVDRTGAGNRHRPQDQIVVGDRAAADGGAAIELAVVGRGAGGVGQQPRHRATALLLKVAALFTTPVMVALFSTSPVPETATVPEIRLLLVTVPPLTVAPPLS